MKRPLPARPLARLAAALLAGLAAAGAAGAEPLSHEVLPESSNDLGFSYSVVSSGSVTTLDLRLKATKNFDLVSVERGSGVASLAPPCQFAGVVAGGSYGCRVELTGTPDHPGMTLNIVGQRKAPGAVVPEIEMHHVSLANAAFAPGARPRSQSQHVLPGSASRRATP